MCEELNTEALSHREENENHVKISFVFRRFPFFSAPPCLCVEDFSQITSHLLVG